MAGPTKCGICNADNRAEQEAFGDEALAGTRTWRNAGIASGCRAESLKRHMLNHVIEVAVEEALAREADEFDSLILEARQGLLEQFSFAPADVKPLILVAIQNLDGLRHTKASQQQLIAALKTVQEMTGMKNEQRMLLGFAKAMFGEEKRPVIDVRPPKLALVEGGE